MTDTRQSTDFPVHLFEEHSSSLPVWWQARQTPHTLVYLDAHLDLQQLAESQLEALTAARTLDQIKALEAPNHLNPSPRFAFGIENFLCAAQHLNLIKRLIWVTPPHIPRHYSTQILAYIQQMDGVTFEELSSFKPLGDGALRGQLLGLDITLCDYRALHSLNLEHDYYLDIDIDYFITVPQDRLWIDPKTVMTHIRQQLGEPRLATISRAVDSGFTPLPMRFIADYCAALIKQNGPDSDHFNQLYNALILIEQRQTEKAQQQAQQAAQSRPDCAASQFILGIALQHTGQPREAANARERAASLDSHYGFELGRAASGFPNRHRDIDNTQLEALRAQLNSYSDAPARVALALLLAGQGALTPASQLLQSLQGDFKNHATLALEIARGILASATPSGARPLLELAASARQTRTTANMLLGDLADEEQNTRLALHHYTLAGEFAPAWDLPLQQQLRCYKKLGEQRRQQPLRRLIKARERILAALLEAPQGQPNSG